MGGVVFPKKRVAAGALIFDAAGRLLLVKGTYGEKRWGVVGGVIEERESPRAGLAREVREETGLTLAIGRLLVVDHTSADERSDDSLQMLFDGGVLDAGQIAAIRLPAEELSEHGFFRVEDAVGMIGSAKLARRVPWALAARAEGRTEYLEDGVPVGHGG
jgi:8-oxo-dGTP diphosphatase